MIKSYFLVLIIAFLSNTLFGQNEYYDDNGVYNGKDKDKVVPFAIVEKPPVAPNCNPNSDTGNLKMCTSKFIQEYFRKNLDGQDFRNAGVSDSILFNISFVIKSDGGVEIIEINIEDPSLKMHMDKAIKSLPKFIPGKEKGKNVDVLYLLPISYRSSK